MQTVRTIIAEALRDTPASFAHAIRQEIERCAEKPYKLYLARDFATMVSAPIKSDREHVIASMVDALTFDTNCVGAILEAARRVTEPTRERFSRATEELMREVFANL